MITNFLSLDMTFPELHLLKQIDGQISCLRYWPNFLVC